MMQTHRPVISKHSGQISNENKIMPLTRLTSPLPFQISVLLTALGESRLGSWNQVLINFMPLQWANIKWLFIQQDDDLKITSASPKIDKKIVSICLVYQEKGRTILSFGECVL